MSNVNLQKGVVYAVNSQYDFMKHERGEYHSTFSREVDGAPLHNMIIRMQSGDLEIGVFLDEEIEGISVEQSI